MTKDESTLKKSTEKIDQKKAIPSYIDGGYGWVIVFASFGIQFVNLGILCVLGVIYSQILEEFNEGSAYTYSIQSLRSLSTAMTSPLSSYLVGIYGHRSVTIFGGMLGTVSLLVSYYAQNVLTLIITIGIGLGSGIGLTMLPSTVCVNMYFEKYVSTAVGIVFAGAGVGTFICAPAAAYLSEEYGWRLTLVFFSGIVFTCVVFGGLFRPIETTTNEENADRKEDSIKPTIGDVIKDPIVILMSTSGFFAFVGYYVPYFCLTDRAAEVGLTKQQGSYFISIIGVSNIFGRIFWGYICDKPCVNRLWVFTSSLLISGIATIACVFGTNFEALAIYSIVYGFIIGAYIPLQSVVISDLVGINRLNHAFGIVGLFKGFGTFAGLLGVGFLHDLMHSYLHGFLLGGICLGLGGLLLFFIPILRKRVPKNSQDYVGSTQL